MTVDHHLLAALALTGSSIDVLGALYLAYDLLGGEHGPLRTLTRGVTYGVFYSAGFGLAMGPAFGLASGASHGLTLAWEFGRASRGHFDTPIWRDVVASGLRAAGFAIGASWLFGTIFGITFGLLSWVGQAIAYRLNIRPTLDYSPGVRVRITPKQLLAAVNRTFGYGAAGYICSIISHQYTKGPVVAIQAGLTIGAVTAASTLVTQ